MNSILYLLITEQKTAFKIGITDNMLDRYMQLRSAWGELDLASSCMVYGDRHEVHGIEKTLHFLLEKWRIDQPVKAAGHSEWFSMECFDKAIEIINTVTSLRGVNAQGKIIHGIAIDGNKKHKKIIRRRKAIYEASANFDDLQQQWPFYEKGTLDFRDHPYIEGLWLWTLDISECLVHPLDAMRFQANGSGINLTSGACCYVNEPSIVQVTLSKDALLDMKKSAIFRQVYEFTSGKIKRLLSNDFPRPESFDIELTPVFQERP